MPVLSDISRRKKIRYFLDPIPKDARILEVGCGEQWVGEYLRGHGWKTTPAWTCVHPPTSSATPMV